MGALIQTRRHLGNQNLDAGVLGAPPELRHGPDGAAKGPAVVGEIVQVTQVTRRSVHPRAGPQQLVLHE